MSVVTDDRAPTPDEARRLGPYLEQSPLVPAFNTLRNFRALVLDADGVWWDGRETRSRDGTVSKTRDMRDGQGLSFMRALGVRVLFATAEESGPLASIVEKLNALPSVGSGEWWPVDTLGGLSGGKVETIDQWLGMYGRSRHELSPLAWSDVLYVGDDRTDLEAMRHAGLSVVPSDAQRCARKIAGLVMKKSGGGGAIRDLAELVLDLRGVDESELPPC